MRPHPDRGHEAGEATLLSALKREHHEIDQAVEAYLAALHDGRGGAHQHLGNAFAALRRHIYLEEEFLFPPLRTAGFVAPVFVMVREHGDLWRTMQEIDIQLSGEETAVEVPAACRLLLDQLERHNSKEEPILYPHADGVLGAAASAELKTFLEHGAMPDGWTHGKA